MAINDLNNNNKDYEIDLKKALGYIINSKKLIISSTLALSLLFFIQTTQKDPVYQSTVLLEIGSYSLLNDKEKLIEPVENLIQDLNVEFFYKQKSNKNILKFNSIEGQLLQINYSSPSDLFNKSFIEDTVKYIENRHLGLFTKIYDSNKKQIIREIAGINTEINYIKNSLKNENDSNKKDLIREIEILNIQIPTLKNKIKLLNEIIVQDEANVQLLRSSPSLKLERAAQTPTLEQVVYSYSDQILNHNLEIKQLSSKKSLLKSELTVLENNDSQSEKVFNLTQILSNLESQLEFFENNDSQSEKVFNLTQKLSNLKSQLEFFENNDSQSEKVFNLTQKLSNLESQLKFFENQTPNKTKLINDIETFQEPSNRFLISLFGGFIGFIFSVFIVLIRQSFLLEQK